MARRGVTTRPFKSRNDTHTRSHEQGSTSADCPRRDAHAARRGPAENTQLTECSSFFTVSRYTHARARARTHTPSSRATVSHSYSHRLHKNTSCVPYAEQENDITLCLKRNEKTHVNTERCRRTGKCNDGRSRELIQILCVSRFANVPPASSSASAKYISQNILYINSFRQKRIIL